MSVGLSPQVVTETLHALFLAGENLPNRLILVTTTRGADAVHAHLTNPETGQIAAWGHEWGIDAAGALASTTEIIVIETDSCDKETNRGLALFVRDTERLIREVTNCPETRLHVSIAGGRKTTAALLSVLMALHGRPQDRLTHILVEPETVAASDFFFPTRSERKIFSAGGSAIDSSAVMLHLVDLPVTGLQRGELLASAFGPKADEPRLLVNRGEGRVYWDGIGHDWPPQQVAFLAMLSVDRLSSGAGISRCGTQRSRFQGHYNMTKDARRIDLPDPLEEEWVEQKVSRINKLAKIYNMQPLAGNLIERVGPRSSAIYRVTVNANDIAVR